MMWTDGDMHSIYDDVLYNSRRTQVHLEKWPLKRCVCARYTIPHLLTQNVTDTISILPTVSTSLKSHRWYCHLALV